MCKLFYQNLEKAELQCMTCGMPFRSIFWQNSNIGHPWIFIPTLKQVRTMIAIFSCYIEDLFIIPTSHPIPLKLSSTKCPATVTPSHSATYRNTSYCTLKSCCWGMEVCMQTLGSYVNLCHIHLHLPFWPSWVCCTSGQWLVFPS